MRIDAHERMILILLLALAIVACEDAPEERVASLTVPVTVMPVGVGTVEATVESTGSLLPLREAELIAEVKGICSSCSPTVVAGSGKGAV